jgi:hypothetical protein
LTHGSPGERDNDIVEDFGYGRFHTFTAFLAILTLVQLLMVHSIMHRVSAKYQSDKQVEVGLEQVNYS